jgi:hypothetical protein
MPRLPRLHVPGGCYHVILRGNHRENIFSCTCGLSVPVITYKRIWVFAQATALQGAFQRTSVPGVGYRV